MVEGEVGEEAAGEGDDVGLLLALLLGSYIMLVSGDLDTSTPGAEAV